MILAQTLHGYDDSRGHALLELGGDVPREAQWTIDHLSDLSGYQPAGADFDVYHTGYPVHGYAFAATWLDRSARRAGTVLTHTLLLPSTGIGQVADIFALAHLHRRPASAQDREPYRTTLEAPAVGTPPPMVPASEMRSLAIMLFGTPSRPTHLWEADSPPTDIARAMWGLLEPHHRARFTFCTWAFGVRQLGDEAFRWMGMPPNARLAFRSAVAKFRPLRGFIECWGNDP